jgi:hypothetical protein
MIMFGRRRRTGDAIAPGEPGLLDVTEDGIRLLCPADKHLLADLTFDGKLRIWDRRCKAPYTFDLAGNLPVALKEKLG